MKVIFIVYASHLATDRHKRAGESREKLANAGAWVLEYITDDPANPAPRTAMDIGESRPLPYLKDLLTAALGMSDKDDDVIIWTNDDVQIDPQAVLWAASEVRLHGAISMRRSEPGSSEIHMGRELFAFTSKWLKANLDSIPDFILGAPCFDIVLAALIRKLHGINSTVGNMSADLYPSDTEHRYAIHEKHDSGWAGANEFSYPANLHNMKLAREWCRSNMPSLRL